MSTPAAHTSPHRGRVRIERGAKRVRAYLGGQVVADTTRPVFVWEVPGRVIELPSAVTSRRYRTPGCVRSLTGLRLRERFHRR